VGDRIEEEEDEVALGDAIGRRVVQMGVGVRDQGRYFLAKEPAMTHSEVRGNRAQACHAGNPTRASCANSRRTIEWRILGRTPRKTVVSSVTLDATSADELDVSSLLWQASQGGIHPLQLSAVAGLQPCLRTPSPALRPAVRPQWANAPNPFASYQLPGPTLSW